MNNPLLAVQTIDRLIADWRDGRETPAAAYSAIRLLCFSLEQNAREMNNHRADKALFDLHANANELLGADDPKGDAFKIRTDMQKQINDLLAIFQ